MLSRRGFLGGGLSALALTSCGRIAPLAANAPIVDFHVHLFGTGRGGTGCWLSPQQRAHPNFAFLLRLLDLREDDDDAVFVERLLAQLRASSVDKAVLLAQDGRYDERGELRRESTHVYVPNDYVLDVVARQPQLLIACVSINPKRRDALAELERCAERDARAVKVHPPTQDVDPGDPAFRPFYRRLAELGLVLIVHTGTEHASDVVGFENCDPARLELALQEGCTVVAAHSGFGSFLDSVDYFDSMQRLVTRFPRLYCDTAVLGSMFRWRNLPRLLATPAVLDRAVHGSDWPFPSNPAVFWNRLPPGELAALVEERNLLERDLRLKHALGLPREYFERGARVLGS